ncbi:MAG: response regulator [Planctomycetes bacterium]|nr:response regulator [Planctomycetota bacterium]
MSEESQHCKMILVEDNDDHAEMVRYYLKKILPDMDLIHLADGGEAIDYFSHFKGEDEDDAGFLVLLDLKLPKYDGIEVLNVIRKTPSCRCIPVVIFSTSCSQKDIQGAYGAGANSYIEKPTVSGGYQRVLELIVNYWGMNKVIL